MNYKNVLTMTAISVIAIFAITSFSGFSIPDAIAQTTQTISVALQPSKMVYVENIVPTAVFKFRDGTEITPIQQFTQTGGFGTTTFEATSSTAGTTVGAQADGGERTGRSKPAFTVEKIVGGTPHLYRAADDAQKFIQNPAFEHMYKYFDVTVYLHIAGTENALRAFEYRDCQVKNYVVTTRSDNEEGYTGKGFVYVDQFALECDGYTPLNPAMDALKNTEKAKTISSSDLRSTDKWEPGFSVKP
jgi:hypothetical protein